MSSREIALWVDERWYQALSRQLKDEAVEDKLNHPYAEASDPEHKVCRVRWGKASFFVNKADMMALYGTNAL